PLHARPGGPGPAQASRSSWTSSQRMRLADGASVPGRTDGLLQAARLGPLIPRILHQIWVGPDPLPEEFARYRETWLQRHPEWEHHLWTENNLPPDLRRPEAYERLRAPAERSDILRYEVLWRWGGVYGDADFECHRLP